MPSLAVIGQNKEDQQGCSIQCIGLKLTQRHGKPVSLQWRVCVRWMDHQARYIDSMSSEGYLSLSRLRIACKLSCCRT